MMMIMMMMMKMMMMEMVMEIAIVTDGKYVHLSLNPEVYCVELSCVYGVNDTLATIKDTGIYPKKVLREISSWCNCSYGKDVIAMGNTIQRVTLQAIYTACEIFHLFSFNFSTRTFKAKNR